MSINGGYMTHGIELETDPELLKLLAASTTTVSAMSDEQRQAMHKAQRESYVRAEIGADW